MKAVRGRIRRRFAGARALCPTAGGGAVQHDAGTLKLSLPAVRAPEAGRDRPQWTPWNPTTTTNFR
ncbi:hypothetical protein PSP6_490051 [Paraburkholderia tropica]|nr:hypothetical protein PSP6_490051 [Paraburkholderia tropica]